MITIKTQIGKNVIEVTADTAKKAIEQCAFFQNIPDKCPVCGAGVKFTYRTPQEYTYYGLECTGDDHHSTNFGQHKDGGTLYYKHGETWTSYKERKQDSQPEGDAPWDNNEEPPSY